MTFLRTLHTFPLLLVCVSTLPAAEWRELPLEAWEGRRIEVSGIEGERLCATAYPPKAAAPLVFRSEESYSPGLYRLRLTLRPSHVCDAIAWRGGFKTHFAGAEPVTPAKWKGIHFARVHEPETKEIDFLLTKTVPLAAQLSAHVDKGAFEQAMAEQEQKSGDVPAPALKLGVETDEEGLTDELALDVVRDPKSNFYYVLDKAELTCVSRSAYVSNVHVSKIRYEPGETLKGHAVIRRIAQRAKGKLRVFLEHDVKTRVLCKEFPIELTDESARTEFEIALPERELGHALVAHYVSEDGQDIHEAAEYFNIADNFYRVAIHALSPFHQYTFRSEEQMRRDVLATRRNYVNCREIFFWAEEDMVEMSPADDHWFSGQTCYHMCKRGLQNYIRLAHEQGLSVATYGKFIMSGYLGWRRAYEYPFDHKRQYRFGLGMWEGSDVPSLDRFRNKEFVGPAPKTGGLFENDHGRLPFMPIKPDPTPRNVRAAAEEMMRSVEMFGWDGVRWDGHPRGNGSWGNSCGGVRGNMYDYNGHRKTQLLVHYFKDLVSAKCPKFRHGYNYLHIQDRPHYDWAHEDFELDELCRGGGLLMNESIRKSHGRTFDWLARNLQVEGDLVRERGGFLLAISADHVSPRDTLVESILYFAAGCRPMIGAAGNRLINRYGTRYSRYTFDETLRRLIRPEALLHPVAETRLWWDPFVYETRPQDGRAQLVVNLINVPRKARLKGSKSFKNPMELAPGTDACEFEMTLPLTHRLTAAHLIDPFTLRVDGVERRGSRLPIPPVNLWRVLILDLAVQAGATSLAEKYGPPKTVAVQRKNLKVERIEFRPLGIARTAGEANREFASRFPAASDTWWKEPDELPTLSWPERNQAVLKRRQPIEHYLKSYPYGVKLPADLKLKDSPPQFDDLAPERNGMMDIFYARGSFDHKLRLYRAFARLDRMQVREARFVCPFSGKSHSLTNNLAPHELGTQDLLIYVEVPHSAIGVRQCYAMVQYVKAGGAVLFSGGEYAFGKGRYAHTILDRELLPVVSVEPRDNRYSEEPLFIQPGKDFGELKVRVDFSEPPAFWCWNQVALRPGADVNVFLRAGNRPILVGWHLGKGRVACLLAMHRGKSEGGVTAFFDWADWPLLTEALLRWLAPDAFESQEKVVSVDTKELAALREQFDQAAMGDELGVDDETDAEDGPDALLGDGVAGGTRAGDASAKDLDAKKLKDRVSLIRRMLKGQGTEISAFLAEQLVAVGNIPNGLRSGIIDFVARFPPPNLSEMAEAGARTSHPDIRGCGYQLLAIAGVPAFVKEVKSEPSAFETSVVNRGRYLALAVALYGKNDLIALGRKRIAAWNAKEQEIQERYTRGKGFSMATPEHPCLDTESLFARVGWLAYLARWEPQTYAPQLAREWARLAQWGDYCDRAVKNIWESLAQSGPKKGGVRIAKQRTEELRLYQVFLRRMSEVTRARVQSLFRAHPEEVAKTFVPARFLLEAKHCINLLGAIPARDSQIQLETLQNAKLPLLREFASERLGTVR